MSFRTKVPFMDNIDSKKEKKKDNIVHSIFNAAIYVSLRIIIKKSDYALYFDLS